ncbi:MAG: anaerobic ribonucleoside-triphosphate reductase activating protein [Clostridiales bacterium]|jgi:pyruvate formate lyase activating enzyme|nr:anaerobic ribonucleoside-triphosphate reductase activating protein [Clostridiales bacterium]
MKIYGLQKLTLLDFSGRLACTVFTGGCNFRCPFCHNASLVRPFISLNDTERSSQNGDTARARASIDISENVSDKAAPADVREMIDEEEFFRFLKKRESFLEGVCVTGGEPLLAKGIEEFLERIKRTGFAVKLDTNGSFPDKLISLVKNKTVDYVAMDIKNSLEKYSLTAGAPVDTSAIKKSAEFLLGGTLPFEFRTTVVQDFHTAEDFENVGIWLKGNERYFLQLFRPSENVLRQGLTVPSDEEMKNFLTILQKYIPNATIRGE